ncbi:MAG: hypothetical protein KGL39_45615 [Patescibacteria group bacterium]|nr:hypothetical protein [Patescibacteria group bacterium]
MTIINPLPYTIANGQAVDATPVQANLNQIVSNVNANAAAVAGNASQEFLVATTTNPAGAVPLAQAQSQFAPVSGGSGYAAPSGSASQVFAVGAAASGTAQAPQAQQLTNGSLPIAATTVASGGTGTTPATNDNSTLVPTTAWVWNSIQALVASVIAAVATAAGFATNFGANGYVKFPSWLGGFIVQWVQTSASPSIPGGSTYGQTITLPIAFPTACVTAIANPFSASATLLSAQIISTSTTSIAVELNNTSSVTYSAAVLAIALGH